MGDPQEVLAEPMEPEGSCWGGQRGNEEKCYWKLEGDPCYVVVEGSGALLPAENRKHP